MTAFFNAIIAFFTKIGLIFTPGEPLFDAGGESFYVSFEGLGIGCFKINPVAFWTIRWYGILITIGIVLAFLYVAKWRAKDAGYHFDDILDFVLFTVPIGVLGARLFYVFTYPGFPPGDWYKIWEGGLAIYGGIIFGILTILVVALVKKVRVLRLMDCTAPAVMLAQAIGRWGNFCNGEAFGAETNFFLRMGLSNEAFGKGGAYTYVHPTFLYESLWNLLGFALINVFFKKKKFDGQITLEYIGWYGLGRFFIELLRQDSLPLTLGEHHLRISSVIGFLCFAVCLVLFLVNVFKPRSPLLDEPCYYPGAKRLKLMEIEKAAKEAAAAKEARAESDAPSGGQEEPEAARTDPDRPTGAGGAEESPAETAKDAAPSGIEDETERPDEKSEAAETGETGETGDRNENKENKENNEN